MHEPILPLGYHDIPDAWGQWISNMAPWRWFVTMTFREVELTNVTKAPQKTRAPQSEIPLKTSKNTRTAPRLSAGVEPLFVNGIQVKQAQPLLSHESRNKLRESDMVYEHSTAYTKPGWAYAKRAWREFVRASAPPIDDRQWVRVFELQRYRGVPHIHALMTASEGSPKRMDMVDWGWHKFGTTRVHEYDPKLGAAHYLGKYLLKDYGKARDNFDIDFGGFSHV